MKKYMMFEAIKKIWDMIVFIISVLACVAIVYFGICYFNILSHNLEPDGYTYPSWNILAIAIEEAGQ